MARTQRPALVTRARAGIALLATLLGILLLEIVVAGTFHLAITQQRIATARVRSLRLDVAARAAAASALEWWPAAASLAPGDSVHLSMPQDDEAVTRSAVVRHVRPSLFVVQAAAWYADGERRELALLLRTASPQDYLADIAAAAAAPLAHGTGTVSSGSACGSAAGLMLHDTAAPGIQTDALLLADSLRAARHLAGVDLARVAVETPPGSFSMAPAEIDGSCDTSVATNWGAADPAHPCASFRPMRYYPGDVTISGWGQGILIADGDIELAAGAQFHGLVVARGRIRLDVGAALDGALRSDAGLEMTDAVVRFDACALERAFRANPRLLGPFRAAPHWWIPLA